MYLDDLAAAIRSRVPTDRIPKGDSDELFRFYAVLLRAKGTTVTHSDIHDAWTAWAAGRQGPHPSLVPYDELPPEVQEEDRTFTAAVKTTAEQFSQNDPGQNRFSKTLYPQGGPTSDTEKSQVFELYKIMVESSENLVGRRQGVNTFFLTINGALLTAFGIIVQRSGGLILGGIALGVLAVAGAILCAAWRSLILSFGQLNTGKFKVISAMERHLSASIYAAEWEALGKGGDPKIYRSFTSREIWVPNALLVLHTVATLAGFSIALIQWITRS